MLHWLILQDSLDAMRYARENGLRMSEDQRAEFEARTGSGASGGSRILTIAGDQAEVAVEGVLTQRPDFWAMFFAGGNTTYGDIVAALAEADADPAVKSITLAVNSPGGQFDGLFDALAAIQGTGKPVRAVVNGVAASAAYAIVSQADEILAAGPASRVGSIGVVASYHVDEAEVEITSTEAPKKRPDVTTEEGRAVVREHLDALHDLFVEAIADGRGVSTSEVNKKFGRGAMVLAGQALELGMIDSVIERNSTKSQNAASGTNQEGTSMDLVTLEREHPETYAAAVAVGVSQERDRVNAHLTMARATGAHETATQAIEAGEGMTATLQAQYLAAGLKRKEVDDRQADEAGAEGADGAEGDVDATEATETAFIAGLEGGMSHV